MNRSTIIALNLLLATSLSANAAPAGKNQTQQKYPPQIGDSVGTYPATGGNRAAVGEELWTAPDRDDVGEFHPAKQAVQSTKTRAEVKNELRIARERGEISMGENDPVKW